MAFGHHIARLAARWGNAGKPLTVTAIEEKNWIALSQAQHIEQIIRLRPIRCERNTICQIRADKEPFGAKIIAFQNVSLLLDPYGDGVTHRGRSVNARPNRGHEESGDGRIVSDTQSGSNATEFSVTEISQAVKRTVEDAFGYVRIRGEISGYRGPHSSGHAYFRLKDDRAQIDAVVWRGVFGKLKFKPEEGMEMIATGKLTTFPGSSKYQIVIDRLEPAGVGALMALLEERRKKLAAEGLFDDTRKRPLPFLPRVIGVVTSPTGAVIRDILHRLTDRFPVRVIVWPVRVQGETSAAEVTNAIQGFNCLSDNALPRPDLLIVARGGGSLEDLWSFNEENVVRAVAASTIPVMSAVGHETDWTLIDHVADRRAPTPTGAAEMAVPVRHELVAGVESLGLRLHQSARRNLDGQKRALTSAARALPSLDTLFGLPRQRFDAVGQRLTAALAASNAAHRRHFLESASQVRPRLLSERLARGRDRLAERHRRLARGFTGEVKSARQKLDAQAQLLKLVSYQSVLQRGFGLVRDEAGQPVRAASLLNAGQGISIEFADGRAKAVVAGDGSAQSVAKPKPKARSSPSAQSGSDQGNLF